MFDFEYCEIVRVFLFYENMKFRKYRELFKEEKVQELLNKGLTIRQISEVIKIPEKRLGEMVKYFNLKVINKGTSYNVDHNFFDNIDTQEKAYVLGFLVADGSIEITKRKYKYSKRVSFNNSTDDIETIKKIRDLIIPDYNLSVENRSTKEVHRKDQVTLKFTSDNIVDKLVEKYKVLPNKNQDFNFRLPELGTFSKDFIRGFFDGDGNINRGNNLMGFISTSKLFLKDIAKEIQKEVEFTCNETETEGKSVEKYYRLLININKTNVVQMYNYLYKGSKIHLLRKEKIFKEKIDFYKL